MASGYRRHVRRAMAAALLGLAAMGCDDRPPPNMPGDTWPEAPAAQQPKPKPAQAAPAAAAGGQRYGALIAINPDRQEEFVRLHEKMPRAVKEAMHRSGIRNYSVFLCGTRDQLYAIRYYQYVGDEHGGDMADLGRDPDFKTWRNACEECQVTLMPLASGEWWAPSKEILHLE